MRRTYGAGVIRESRVRSAVCLAIVICGGWLVRRGAHRRHTQLSCRCSFETCIAIAYRHSRMVYHGL